MYTELGFFDVVSPILGYFPACIIPLRNNNVDGLDLLEVTDYLAFP